MSLRSGPIETRLPFTAVAKTHVMGDEECLDRRLQASHSQSFSLRMPWPQRSPRSRSGSGHLVPSRWDRFVSSLANAPRGNWRKTRNPVAESPSVGSADWIERGNIVARSRKFVWPGMGAASSRCLWADEGKACLYGYGEDGSPYWASRHATVFSSTQKAAGSMRMLRFTGSSLTSRR